MQRDEAIEAIRTRLKALFAQPHSLERAVALELITRKLAKIEATRAAHPMAAFEMSSNPLVRAAA